MPLHCYLPNNKVVALGLVFFFFSAIISTAQVVSPVEIKDQSLRDLQTTYLDDLEAVGREIVALKTDYPFYLSRKLTLDEAAQKAADQRSIRFDVYNGKTVLAITGNYYASYETAKVGPERRARETYLQIVVPILKAAAPRFQNNRSVRGYAVEVSHHVRGTVMNVDVEHPENLFVFLPQNAALKFLAAKDETAQQAALLQGQFLLNGEPVTVWLNGEAPAPSANHPPEDDSAQAPDPGAEESTPDARSNTATPSLPKAKAPKPKAPPPPPRDTSSAALAALQTVNQHELDMLTKELSAQTQLVTYAPPAFYVFRQEIYLQVSMNTEIAESANGSHYKLAALAFDDHVSHLVRPALAHFKGDQQFDGFDFSTTVHPQGKKNAGNSESVEFLMPFSAMRCYEKFECTGQQLIDASTILINGERVSLDLQVAEGAQ